LAVVVIGSITRVSDSTTKYGDVELLRDKWGTPHVFADTDQGAMYGLGYAAAQDRGFQMHYFLRTIQGRLSEVLGVVDKRKVGAVGPNNTVEHDRLMRVFGFAAAAEEVVSHLDAETRELLLAYSAGVNDYFEQNADREHYLFKHLGLEREPWTPVDCVLSWWHFGQFFAKNGLRDHPGLSKPERRGRGPRIVVDDEAAVVRREDVTDQWIAQVDQWLEKMKLAPQAPNGPQDPDPKFSHAWVISGAKTSTGSALLVSDPQTPVWNPSMLYEFHAQGATFNARGVGVAGSPIILIGFNEHVAWGITALGADQADLFILKTDDAHTDQYQVDGQWLDMHLRREIIRVRDEEPREVTVRETIFGPVVSDLVWRNPAGQQVALSRVPMVETDRETTVAALGMLRAKSCEQFAAALPDWRFPTANCVFGDADGNIGYWSLGALPVRSTLTGSDGSHAQDGSTRRGMWQAMIPYQFLPHCLNPKRGYLVTANHRTIQSFYRVPFGNMTGSAGDTDRGLRIKQRIQEHLDEHSCFTPEDVLAIQYDSVNVWKREIIRLGYKALKENPDGLSRNAREALRYLREWYAEGAQTDMNVPGTELVNEMSVIFRGNVSTLVSKYGGGVSGLALFAKTVRARDAADPDRIVPKEERTFVDTVLDQAWRRSLTKYGDDVTKWNDFARAALCTQKLIYMESLDGFPGLDSQYDVTLPLLTTIDGATVLSQRAQAYTQFVTMHDPDQSKTILPIGSSDDPRSPFRFSTYGDWSQGKLNPAPLSRAAVDALTATRESLGRRHRNGRPQRQPTRPDRRRRAEASPRDRMPKIELPGKAPDDPTLEMAIRYLNRAERTEEEVATKLRELEQYIANDARLKAELLAALERFTFLMRESQAGRLPITYGTPTTLKLVDRLYTRLNSDKLPD
jgi:penicillin amidase